MEAQILFCTLLALTCLFGHLLHLKKVYWITEGALALLVGLTAGGLAYCYYEYYRQVRIPQTLFAFDTELFFHLALPIIIFNAGFSIKKKLFFQNFLTLVLFGVVGTFLTAGGIATASYFTLHAVNVRGRDMLTDSLALGAIFSSSDSIATLQMLDQDSTPLLYSLVFGEGVVNDATSIVLLRAIQAIGGKAALTGGTLGALALNFSQLFVFSLMLGVAMGLLSAYIIKHAFVRHSTDREVCLVALLGFLAYLLAEALHLSGIFAVFFAGIAMSHYTWHGLSPSAKVVTVYLFRILSFLTELFLFIYAGFGCWSTSLWHRGIYSRAALLGKAALLATSLLGQVFLSRGAVLMLLVALANLWRPRSQRIGLRDAVVIWWAGSARGAITIALAYQRFTAEAQDKEEVQMQNQILVVASMAVVIFTTVVLGAVTAPFLDCLIGDKGEDEVLAPAVTGASELHYDGSASLQRPLLGHAGRYLQKLGHWNTRSYIHIWWHKLDARFLQPLFGGRKPRPEGYKSPPPSPGRETMYSVIGPHVLKRHGQAREQASSQAAAEQQGASERMEAELPPGSPRIRGGPASGQRDSVEELFCTHSTRLDSELDGLEWQDRKRFGEEGAYLAAGAPDEAAVAAAAPSTEGPGSSSRHQPRRQRSFQRQPLWPSPFDRPEDEAGEAAADEEQGVAPEGRPAGRRTG